MLNFYPGPSKLHANIDLHLQQAITSGILSMNHRSMDFMQLYQQVQENFEQFYDLPKDYKVYFTSAATECWTILAQSFPNRSFLHLYNGSFGKKWMEVSKQLEVEHTSVVFDIHGELPVTEINPDTAAEIVCTTLVETSNGTFLSKDIQAAVRETFSDALIAVDATSALAGLSVTWEHADIWFASVQKCFGLPSGLGILILSPTAQHTVEFRSKDIHYNSLKRIVENGASFQTTHTPNILGIYLLAQRLKEIDVTEFFNRNERMNYLYNHFSSHPSLQPLIIEKSVQSATVLTLKGDEEYIKQVKKSLKAQDIIIGSGYGVWKENTIRLANFPAHTDEDFKKLLLVI
ncbi:aminotransferase class V-fold PLP-dependent enzyme [Cytophaga hutchinsonii]|jgi:phosphoserine aminotransferase|uniref:Phosphoserine aminotransferase apoenzyme n=1 Tax=Cytophaga hutchinsonii (strain ATCC 33406 / DSM 1761 / CIP 103989 / NBRC 15051 / NCIMB 9469 / D465) TaxID=269798 RepID=A0A6N4SU94_CYTH3|nr:aminotransferase class V-fold PLP-dependent enzyme [Cytophaga hutchinsonii]ABG59955.1 phosphoserine aminotransferase apoenzyme [Cytophaga hutchinsonii ATCC 33406]SFX26768.1 phosphoserine aminotransferase [Cytophaga hutchinsonii ATCC 33406]